MSSYSLCTVASKQVLAYLQPIVFLNGHISGLHASFAKLVS